MQAGNHFRNSSSCRALASLVILLALFLLPCVRPALAAGNAAIDADVQAALDSLYATTPSAQALGQSAKAILVFPNIVKAGFIVGAQYGEGSMIQNGATLGYYSVTAASYGLQAGVQSFGYAMFLMTDSAVKYLEETAGFELGTGPSIVIVDEGMARSLSTSTLQSDIYAFTFGQKGLMAGLGLQGTKISKLNR